MQLISGLLVPCACGTHTYYLFLFQSVYIVCIFLVGKIKYQRSVVIYSTYGADNVAVIAAFFGVLYLSESTEKIFSALRIEV